MHNGQPFPPDTRGLPPDTDFDAFVGNGPAMQRVYALILRAATSDAPVLLTGETGTGKELAAQSLHQRSRRAQGPFVTLNCAALPADMIESELFGFRRGAFTGASSDHMGIFYRASGGTLFLDEITEMPPHLQAKLLRVVETGRYAALGDTRERHADVRIIAASNRDAKDAIASGFLRSDLYYRLSGLHIAMPPLRTRGAGDVQRLASFLLARIATAHHLAKVPVLSAAAYNWLLRQSFAGNVRELNNILQQAAIMHEVDVLEPHHLAPHGMDPQITAAPVTLAEAERLHIQSALDNSGGNMMAAARQLGIDASTLHRKRKLWQNADTAG